MNPIKKITVIILVGLTFSFLFSAYSINKFDVYEISTDDKHYHSMIKGVNANHWIKAKKIRDQLSQGKNYFETGEIYDRNYLPSKIFLLYSYFANDELVESQNNNKIVTHNQEDNKIVTDKKKIIFLIFQSILYFLSLFFFFF